MIQKLQHIACFKVCNTDRKNCCETQLPQTFDRRDLKKREKKGLGIDENEETRHRKEIDPLKRRVDTLEVTMLQRSGESEALKRR